jgi:uncharacterized repeat protein (TIGR03803 family)
LKPKKLTDKKGLPVTIIRPPHSGWHVISLFAMFILIVVAATVAKAQNSLPNSRAIEPPTVTLTPLVDFDGSDGSYPYAQVAQGRDGNYYGTTSEAGYSYGTVFKITPAGKLTTLYNFATDSRDNGSVPYAGLILGTNGDFYGTASGGGPYNGSFGTVFKITPAGKLSVLYSFCPQSGCADGAVPDVGLIQATNGNFYGTTSEGGTGASASNSGTIFTITPAGKLTKLYSFCNLTNCADGWDPSGLIQATDGVIYGTTVHGGIGYDPGGDGTFFKITPDGITTLYKFCSESDCADGAYPHTLIQAADGDFYGTNSGDGVHGAGSVFKITATGVLTTLYSFCAASDCADGANPVGLVQATDGNFYGTTVNGGAGDLCGGHPCGTIFEITAGGSLTTLWDFCGSKNCTDGTNPGAPLIQATNGNFYGTTEGGWAGSSGTVFRLSTGLGPFVAFVRSSGEVGSTAEILGQGFTGTTAVSFNGTAATFTVVSDSYMTAIVPTGATTGKVIVTTPTGQLTSNVNFKISK